MVVSSAPGAALNLAARGIRGQVDPRALNLRSPTRTRRPWRRNGHCHCATALSRFLVGWNSWPTRSRRCNLKFRATSRQRIVDSVRWSLLGHWRPTEVSAPRPQGRPCTKIDANRVWTMTCTVCVIMIHCPCFRCFTATTPRAQRRNGGPMRDPWPRMAAAGAASLQYTALRALAV